MKAWDALLLSHPPDSSQGGKALGHRGSDLGHAFTRSPVTSASSGLDVGQHTRGGRAGWLSSVSSLDQEWPEASWRGLSGPLTLPRSPAVRARETRELGISCSDCWDLLTAGSLSLREVQW